MGRPRPLALRYPLESCVGQRLESWGPFMTFQAAASHFIDGRYVEDTDGAAIDAVYPATGETIARLRSATPAVFESALAAAGRAQKGWAALTANERGRLMAAGEPDAWAIRWPRARPAENQQP